MKKARGCEARSKINRPVLTEIRGDTYYRYWSCPLALIPRSVYGFLKLRKYYDFHKGAPAPLPSKVNRRYALAFFFYENRLSGHLQEATKER